MLAGAERGIACLQRERLDQRRSGKRGWSAAGSAQVDTAPYLHRNQRSLTFLPPATCCTSCIPSWPSLPHPTQLLAHDGARAAAGGHSATTPVRKAVGTPWLLAATHPAAQQRCSTKLQASQLGASPRYVHRDRRYEACNEAKVFVASPVTVRTMLLPKSGPAPRCSWPAFSTGVQNLPRPVGSASTCEKSRGHGRRGGCSTLRCAHVPWLKLPGCVRLSSLADRETRRCRSPAR